MVTTKPQKRENRITIPLQTRPRHEALNAALVGLGGGRMKSPKDFNRAREKLVTHEALKDLT